MALSVRSLSSAILGKSRPKIFFVEINGLESIVRCTEPPSTTRDLDNAPYCGKTEMPSVELFWAGKMVNQNFENIDAARRLLSSREPFDMVVTEYDKIGDPAKTFVLSNVKIISVGTLSCCLYEGVNEVTIEFAYPAQ